MIKRVDNAVFLSVQAFKTTGKLTSHSYNLKDEGVAYSTSGGFVDDIKSKLEDYKAKIIAGTIVVNTK
jgi:basic membrane protein A